MLKTLVAPSYFCSCSIWEEKNVYHAEFLTEFIRKLDLITPSFFSQAAPWFLWFPVFFSLCLYFLDASTFKVEFCTHLETVFSRLYKISISQNFMSNKPWAHLDSAWIPPRVCYPMSATNATGLRGGSVRSLKQETGYLSSQNHRVVCETLY